MGVLSNIEPNGVFRFFEEICGIPHGSSDTKMELRDMRTARLLCCRDIWIWYVRRIRTVI